MGVGRTGKLYCKHCNRPSETLTSESTSQILYVLEGGFRYLSTKYEKNRLLSPPFTRQWNPGRYYQVTRAPRPGQPQFLINYYILFFIQYILVSRSAFQARQRNGRLFEGEHSRITTVTLPRTSCLRNLEPPMFASLFFSLFGHAFSRFSRRPTPPVLSLFLVLVPVAQTKQHFDAFEQPQRINTLLQLLLQYAPPCARGIYKPLFS